MTSRPPAPEKAAPSGPQPRLIVQPREGSPAPLYPSQSAAFDILLRNDNGVPLRGKSVSGNLDTPIVRLFGPQGMYGAFDTRARGERMVGDLSTLQQGPPSMVDLAPGAAKSTPINLWGYHDPLPPGSYAVDAVHSWENAGPPLISPRVAFEIVPARVHAAALGYNSRLRAASWTAWLAATSSRPSIARLLLRESGSAGHASLHQGGTPLGEFPSNAAVALGALPFDAMITSLGWVAVVEPNGQAHAILQASTFPQQPAISFSLGITRAIPLPRFPIRGAAIVLATGLNPAGSPVLAGAVAKVGATIRPWHVSLSAHPVFTACTALQAGGIQILYASDDGVTSRLHLLEVSESGEVLIAERIVRTTPNQLLALAVGQRSTLAHFLALEAERSRPNRLTLARIPATSSRPIELTEFAPLSGWPHTSGVGDTQPEAVEAVHLEQTFEGAPWIALTSLRGDIYCGPAAGPLTLKHEAHGQPFTFPAVAAVRKGVSCTAFTPSGEIYFSEGAHSH